MQCPGQQGPLSQAAVLRASCCWKALGVVGVSVHLSVCNCLIFAACAMCHVLGPNPAGPKLTAAFWMVQEDASAKDSTLLDRTIVKLREAVSSKRGSHEQLALLFVALCRGLGLLTRSVR